MQKYLLRTVQALFGFALVYKLADALIPHGHSDPLYYTLHAPKIFHYYGWDVMVNDLMPSVMTGVLEFVTLFYFQFTENLGLIHILAQFLVLGLSLILGAFLIRRWTVNPFVGYLAAFSILTFSRDTAIFTYAKGDGVVGIFAMIAVYCLSTSRKPWILGLFIGLLPAIKLSGLYPAVAIGAVAVIKNSKNPRYFITAGITALAVFMPIMVRNYLGVGNPLFPGFLKSMPGKASPAMIEYYSLFYNVPANIEFVKSAVHDLFLGKLIFGLWVYFFYRKVREKSWDGLSIVACALGTFIVYCLTNGVYQGTRYFFAVFFILALFTFIELDRLFSSKRDHFLKSTTGMIMLLGLALMDSGLDMAPRIIYGNLKSVITLRLSEIVKRETAREWDMWASIPMHPTSPKRILSETTTEGYYLDPLYRLENTDLSMTGGFFKECKEPGDLGRLTEYDYYFLAPEKTNPCREKIRKEGRFLGLFIPNGTEVYSK